MSARPPSWRKYFPAAIFPDRCCNVLCCGRLTPEEDDYAEVIVYMNNPEANAAFKYPSNFICTSKYTVWSFIPLGLFFQFTKVSNLYFLISMIFSLIPGVSPISPATAVAPLVVVVVVALIKEGVEDIQRHQADNRANAIPAMVIRDGELVSVPSKGVQAGDVMHIKIGEEVRADVVLLSSSVEEGQAFIDTCNLDGETSLKSRKAAEQTWALNSVEAVVHRRGTLHTSMPDPGLLSWTGVLELDGEEISLALDQFLYRGCVLRNTDWVWGMVAYAGVDTKVFRNLKEKPPKSSNLDRKLNILIVFIFILQNILLIVIASLAVSWNSQHDYLVYLDYFVKQYERGRLWGYRYLAYFILLGYCVPISLFITVELCKVIQAQWMRVDVEMMEYMVDRWRHCQPNTSNLNEQLAMVRFIFSDKTGTLTENVMKFRRGDVLGYSIDSDDFARCRTQLEKESASSGLGPVQEYLLALALCNTIQPFKSKEQENGVIYEGSSPDEVALVQTAAELGFRLVNRTTRTITVVIPNGTRKVYNILATLEFTPNRKMMSIIVEDSDTKRITLYNKGADSFVKSQLSRGPEVQEHMRRVDSVLTEMSSTGLRTLLVCARDMNRSNFETWNTQFIEAGKVLRNRSDEVDRVCLEIEKDMRLVGATAIEDKLQDEVPETLSFFLSAGVVVWMLTGDKRETAVTIAATSTLCDPRTDYVDHVDIGHFDFAAKEAIDKVGRDLEVVEQHLSMKGTDREKRVTFVLDGPALNIAMQHYFDKFVDLSQRVNSAVCCRLTPIQKANVVHMFQGATGATALAIGDGANDVSMIQEGRVGVGIIGLEGAQAALAADYAIPRFKHLRRLCAVHGRYSLYRNASCILLSFYKNLIIAFCMFIFSFYVEFSSQTPFDGWLLTFFNIVLTSIPPFFMGIFDKDLPEDALMQRPKLYTSLSHGEYFNIKVQLRWFIEAMLSAIYIFFIAEPTMQTLDASNKHYTGKMSGTLIFCGILVTVTTRFALHIHYWQWLQALGIGLSFLFFLLFLILYSAIPSLMGDTSFYYHAYDLWSTGRFWFYMLLYLGMVLFFILTEKTLQKHFFPTLRDVAERQHAIQNGGHL